MLGKMPVLGDKSRHLSLLINFYLKKFQNTKGRVSNHYGNRDNQKYSSKDSTCPIDPK